MCAGSIETQTCQTTTSVTLSSVIDWPPQLLAGQPEITSFTLYYQTAACWNIQQTMYNITIYLDTCLWKHKEYKSRLLLAPPPTLQKKQELSCFETKTISWNKLKCSVERKLPDWMLILSGFLMMSNSSTITCTHLTSWSYEDISCVSIQGQVASWRRN